ncbi:MAG: MarR family transcriptional regulator [Gottschalkiaceae bacterium]|nr:MAG: MarR family transcriptional regulator [Gottschalkiaceae bacterium]
MFNMTDRVNQQFIFGVIFLLANKLQLLGDKVTDEITLKQWFLLNILAHMNELLPNYNDISKAVGTSRQNVSKMLSALDKKGMVELKPSEIDQRAIYVTLTQKSFEYFESKDNAGNLLLDKLFENFSTAEIEQMAMLLGRVLQNAEICLKEN